MGFNSAFKGLISFQSRAVLHKYIFFLQSLTLLNLFIYFLNKNPSQNFWVSSCRSRIFKVKLKKNWALKIYRVFNLKVDRILIWVIYLLRFTTYYVTQLTCIYSKCWKWCPFISMHLSTTFTMFLATFLSALSFFNLFFAMALFTGACLLNLSEKPCLQWA